MRYNVSVMLTGGRQPYTSSESTCTRGLPPQTIGTGHCRLKVELELELVAISGANGVGKAVQTRRISLHSTLCLPLPMTRVWMKTDRIQTDD